MQDDPRLIRAIEEGVSKGVPMDFIAYNLKRAGWPEDVVNETIEKWMLENGRTIKTTDFKSWMARYYKQTKPAIIIVVILDTISSLIALLQPWPLAILANSGFGDAKAPWILKKYTHTSTLVLIVVLMSFSLFIISFIYETFKSYYLLKVEYWLNRRIKEEAFRHILYLPLYHEGRLPKGDYIYRENDLTNSLSDLILNTTSDIIGSVIMMVGVLIVMLLFINAYLTAITTIVVPFLILSIKIYGPIMGKLGNAMVKLQSRSASLISESIDNTEAIQAFTLEERQVARLKDIWVKTYDIAKRGLFWGRAFSFTNEFFVNGATQLAMFIGGSMAISGQFSIGSLLVYMNYIGYFTGPIQEITSQLTARKQKLMNVNRIYEVIVDHENIEHQKEGKTVGRLSGRIEFQNITYQRGDNLILNQVSLTIEPKEKIGIIGPSGAGKSTLMRLLDLYIEPNAGRILIDGYDVQSISLNDLRQNIAWISQSPQLFSSSILDNMKDGDITRNISDQEIVWAEQAANVGEFVDKMPLGIESLVGEGGSSLSGGQKQRISIARALLKNAPILCMDEPTSALDDKSERMILASLGSMIQDKTVIMVTHRPALLSLMDKVYVLSNGNLTDVNEMGGLDQYLYKLHLDGQL